MIEDGARGADLKKFQNLFTGDIQKSLSKQGPVGSVEPKVAGRQKSRQRMWKPGS